MEFTNAEVNIEVLRQRAYNMRWAEVPEGVIPLTAADSDFPAAPEIGQALNDYISGGYFSYTPKLGYPSLREAVAKAMWERKGEKVNPDLVLPIDSAARGMDAIAKTVLEPGDEVIVFDPVDLLFGISMRGCGAKVILYPMKRRADGSIDFSDLEDYITPKTKMLGLCNPHNPLGKLYPLEDLDHILSLSEKYGFYIMNDEVWSDIVYPDATFRSILSLGNDRNKRTLTVFGFSKSFGIAGLRAGVVYCQDKALFDKLVVASQVDTTIGGVSSLTQVAAETCLTKCYYWVDALITRLTKNRDYAYERLNNMPGVTCEKPEATFVIFPDISSFGMSADQLVKYLAEEYKVSLVPGGGFYFGPGSEGHVRICLATSFEILKEGLDRMEAGLKALILNSN